MSDTVQLFIPCFVDQLYPQTGMNTVKILEHCGIKVTYNPQQTCCGQPAYNAGYFDEARQVAQKFIKDFQSDDCIVSPSGSCTGFIRLGLPILFDNHTQTISAQATKAKAFELTEYLINHHLGDKIHAKFHAKVAYHDACGALRECGIKAGPRQLLSRVEGLELVEMDECETCCGFGGTFAVKFETISIAMAQTKVQSAIKAGAAYITSTDVSCLMHLQGYIDKHQLPIQTIHIADILASGW